MKQKITKEGIGVIALGISCQIQTLRDLIDPAMKGEQAADRVSVRTSTLCELLANTLRISTVFGAECGFMSKAATADNIRLAIIVDELRHLLSEKGK